MRYPSGIGFEPIESWYLSSGFSDAKDIANALNSYFCEIGQELQSKFPNTD